MDSIRARLFELRDEKYADFQSKLTPEIPRESFIGVRVPVVREYARELRKEENWESFLGELPHRYYDENMLHSVILSLEKDYGKCVKWVEEFLPYVDNWAVCDIMSPKCFAKNKDKLIVKIREWICSTKVYTCRFGMEMLMSFYLEEDFKEEYLDWVAAVRSEEYYVKMMQAWFFATSLAKQWDSAISVVTERKLDPWTHNKTIQKAIESYRITDEQKAYLRTLKV